MVDIIMNEIEYRKMVFEKIAKEIGAVIISNPEYQDETLIKFRNGKKFYFSMRRFNINKVGPVRVATNKEASSFFLSEFGYNTPKEKVF